MAHAELCPVCNGEGKTLKAGDKFPTPCNGCKDGRGWVEVGDDNGRWYPVYPEPYPLPYYPPYYVTWGDTAGVTTAGTVAK